MYIERQRVDALFGADFMRLRTVLSAFSSITGALAEDSSPIAMPVEPAGFNRTQVRLACMLHIAATRTRSQIEILCKLCLLWCHASNL